MKKAVFAAVCLAAAGAAGGGTVSMVVTNYVTALDVPVVTNLVTITTTNTLTRVVTNAVPSPEAIAAETARLEAEARKRRISTRTFYLAHADATGVADRFNATWSGDFGAGLKVAKIAQAFPEANTVMVTAPGVVLDACEAVIRNIDVEPKQVYIEARFVELGNTAMHKLGIDWSMLENMKGSVALGGGTDQRRFTSGVSEYKTVAGGSQYGNTSYSVNGRRADMSYFSGTLSFDEMYIVLSALERDNDTRTFSNPKIIVSSGKKAVVDMTTKYPNVTVSAKRTLNGNSESLDLAMNMAAIPGEDSLMFAKEAFFSWGISLEVTPRITTNGLINVSIVPTISSLDTEFSSTGFVTADDGSSKSSSSATYSSKYPIIEVQRLVTEFAMKSGTTAVIGGLSRTVEVQIDSGIPWLRDWPWIGDKLFGGKTRQKVQKEILVFVTVGIASPDSLPEDIGLPKNAVLGRQYTEGQRREPGDRVHGVEGVSSLDLRPLDEQARDPLWTNRTEKAESRFPLPFTKKR